MLEAKVQRLIFSSSAAVYGVPGRSPIPESHPLNPDQPLRADEALRREDPEGLRSRLRPEIHFPSLLQRGGRRPGRGAGRDARPGDPPHPQRLLAALGKRTALDLFGTDFPTPDGTAVRDYIHVTDLAAAHVLALEKLLAAPESDFINLGTNRGYSVLEVIGAVESVTGRKVAYEAKPRRQGDVPVLLASKEKAEKTLGWTLRHSSLEEIIRTAWDVAPEAGLSPFFREKTVDARIS